MPVRDPGPRTGSAPSAAPPLRAPAHGDGQSQPADQYNGAAPRRPLIIERPDLQTMAQRYGYLTFTFVAWFMWLYLVVPLLSWLAWAAGLGIIYQAMIQNLATADLIQMLKVYGAGAGLLSGTYLVWAITSLLRWHNVERRLPAAPVDDVSLARSHHLAANQLDALRETQRHVLSAEMLEQMFAPQVTDAIADESERRTQS